ncbi:CDP-alcohol phosphatidyltransferase family protein [Sphingomonas sp. AX6]|uniref:CDP-alcohol phosphatidyltransferase family protein n=1 Tax=Sphingomonas sp. AX6 TaxID=2653171 RepID=UPI0012EF2370|nr:CDP-alcohol phosphatidyltransferase family protein [Sphingomonas sp. AX6]VXC95952.1 putative phosphatidyl transferase, inner membrane protein [Sphingomonas sp. AX6]
MLDAKLRPLIDPPLDVAGRWIARRGIGPNAVTLIGLVPGLAAAVAIAQGAFALGLVLVLLNRLLDGLDGAVARATRQTDFGGYLDIVADFAFYVAVPLGFGFAAPANTLPAMVLVAAFTLTGISFLAFATLAAKRGVATEAHGHKSFFYNTGLAEGTETIFVFVLMCLWPEKFALFAWIYASLCLLTVIQRSALAHAKFRSDTIE